MPRDPLRRRRSGSSAPTGRPTGSGSSPSRTPRIRSAAARRTEPSRTGWRRLQPRKNRVRARGRCRWPSGWCWTTDLRTATGSCRDSCFGNPAAPATPPGTPCCGCGRPPPCPPLDPPDPALPAWTRPHQASASGARRPQEAASSSPKAAQRADRSPSARSVRAAQEPGRSVPRPADPGRSGSAPAEVNPWARARPAPVGRWREEPARSAGPEWWWTAAHRGRCRPARERWARPTRETRSARTPTGKPDAGSRLRAAG